MGPKSAVVQILDALVPANALLQWFQLGLLTLLLLIAVA
jgi:hypothetical protein